MGFPAQRLRRLRKSSTLRNMVRENRVHLHDLICPLFVVPGTNVQNEISTLPGCYHFSIDTLLDEVEEIWNLGIQAILLFGIPEDKDKFATSSYLPNGIIQEAVRAIKRRIPNIIVITDACMCEYTDHGHCGIIENNYLVNDLSLEILGKIAVSHAEAGADIIAPAAMLDGQISTMRNALDKAGFPEVILMSYGVKYSSQLYNLFFRNATQSELSFGDKKTHQMDYGNSNEASREIELDISEGADIVIIKPALFYLDIVKKIKSEFNVPVAVYNVSGEYAMIKAACKAGIFNEKEILNEILTSFKRAGSDLIISYHAKEIASLIKENRI